MRDLQTQEAGLLMAAVSVTVIGPAVFAAPLLDQTCSDQVPAVRSFVATTA